MDGSASSRVRVMDNGTIREISRRSASNRSSAYWNEDFSKLRARCNNCRKRLTRTRGRFHPELERELWAEMRKSMRRAI